MRYCSHARQLPVTCFANFLDQQITWLQWLYAACAMCLGVQHAMLCEAKGRLMSAT